MLEEKLENSLYWGVSLVLNLIIFTLLSLYLSVRIEVKNPTKPMEVYLQEMPEIKEVKLASGRGTPNLRQQTGEGIVRKDRHLVSSSPMEVSRSTGDLQVPAGRPKEEPSLLQEIEQRVRGREREIEKEGVRSADIGDITAVVSPGGERRPDWCNNL